MYKILWVLGAAVWHSSRTISSSNAPVLVGENLHNKFQIHVCLCSMVLDGSQHVIEGSQVG